MTRILVDLAEEDIKWLDARASELGMSRAAVLRDAVAVYKARVSLASGSDWIKRGAGYWSGRAGLADGVIYQRAMREDHTSHEDG
jgi:hypothetical protein